MIKQILPWIIAVLYFFLPFDLIPDVVVGPGWLDDLAVLGLAYWWYTRIRNLYARKASQSGSQGSESSDSSRQNQAYHQKNTQENDPYTVLGIQPGSSKEEIKKAYTRLAAQYHPDKVQHLGEEFRRLAHEKFVAIQKAYEAIK